MASDHNLVAGEYRETYRSIVKTFYSGHENTDRFVQRLGQSEALQTLQIPVVVVGRDRQDRPEKMWGVCLLLGESDESDQAVKNWTITSWGLDADSIFWAPNAQDGALDLALRQALTLVVIKQNGQPGSVIIDNPSQELEAILYSQKFVPNDANTWLREAQIVPDPLA